eukprot:COSAG02_NODE_1029_length_15083_cov_8.066271_10_plen_183_part_00
MGAVNTAYRTCPHVSKNTRGCPRDIPSVSDTNAQQSCSGGDGFWPVGSACAVRCADGFVPAPTGGGHRRAQAADGSVEYICTSGGDWLSPTPLSCVAASAGPPPPPCTFSTRPLLGRNDPDDNPGRGQLLPKQWRLPGEHSLTRGAGAGSDCMLFRPHRRYHRGHGERRPGHSRRIRLLDRL